MTLINLTALETLLNEPGPIARGSVTATYWAGNGPYTLVEGDTVTFPRPVTVYITDGEPESTLDLPATGGVCCVLWVVRSFRGGEVVRRYTSIPSVGPVDFGDLPVVDPASFAPVDPTPTLVETIDAQIAAYLAANPPVATGEQVATYPAASGTVELEPPTEATVHSLTIVGDVTVTLPTALTDAVTSLTVLVTQDATGDHEVSWPDSIKWPGAAAPIPTADPGETAIFVLFTIDEGTSWIGMLSAEGVTAPPAPTVPGIPSGVSAIADTDSISVTWSAPANGGSPITAYRLYRGTASGVLSLYQTLGNVLEYDDTGATPGTTYYYEVTAVNAVGESARSDEVSAAVSSGPTLIGQDTFNRANVTPPGLMSDGARSWGGAFVGDYAILSEAVAGGTGEPIYADFGEENVAVECTRLGTWWGGGLALRVDPATLSHMQVGWRANDGLYIYRNGNTPIAEPSMVCPIGGVLRVEVNGSNWRVFVNGALAYEFTEAFNPTMTAHGISAKNGSVSNQLLDEFKVYAL